MAAAIGLMLLSLGAGLASGITIMIYRNGQKTSVSVGEGRTVNMDENGNVAVTPAAETERREAEKPSAHLGVESDFEAIEAMSEIVGATTHLGGH